MSIFNFPTFDEYRLKYYNETLNTEVNNYITSNADRSMNRISEHFIYDASLKFTMRRFPVIPYKDVTDYTRNPRRCFEVEDNPIKQLVLEHGNLALKAMLIAYPNAEQWHSDSIFYQIYSMVCPYSMRQALGILDVSKDIEDFKTMLMNHFTYMLTRRVDGDTKSVFIKDCKVVHEFSERRKALQLIQDVTLDILGKNCSKVTAFGSLNKPTYYVDVPPHVVKGGSELKLAADLDILLEQTYLIRPVFV
jgi:hypothetical protein